MSSREGVCDRLVEESARARRERTPEEGERERRGGERERMKRRDEMRENINFERRECVKST